MKIIGLTGGIGSGKSTVAGMFEDLKIPVFYADAEAKKLMNNSTELRKKIIDLIGHKAYDNGLLNRSYVADIVFQNKEKLEKLNLIVHPAVENHFSQWVKLQQSPYVIQENALIFESNKQDYFDAVITVTAPLEQRIERVIKRDGIEKELVLHRVQNQLDEEHKVKNANFVIQNISLGSTKDMVFKIHQKLIL